MDLALDGLGNHMVQRPDSVVEEIEGQGVKRFAQD